jgi:hypothetical protein
MFSIFALLPLDSFKDRNHSSTATDRTSFTRYVPQRGKIHLREMNINLGQANGVCLSKWQMWALKHLAGAEAHVAFGALCGTT